MYPSEVESVIAGHPDVADVAVTGVAHPTWGEVGAAFVAVRSGATTTADDIRAFCAGRLARYKQPHHVRILDSLPLTAIGKHDKKALAATVEGGADA